MIEVDLADRQLAGTAGLMIVRRLTFAIARCLTWPRAASILGYLRFDHDAHSAAFKRSLLGKQRKFINRFER
jgi:hypothetical protein